MGCDIHVHVERRVNDVWEPVSGDFDPGRSYLLFGALAGVRNQTFTCIADPRGIPEDSCGEIQAHWEQWSGDGHSASYYLVSELLEARELTQPVETYLDTKDFIAYKEDGNPENWYGLYVPNGYEEISLEEMERRAEQVAFWGNEKFVTKLTCNMRYRTASKFFWDEIVDEMAALDEDPNNVRFVFWFDN